MNIRFCQLHGQQFQRALTSRSLSEFGWVTDLERKEAIEEQRVGHYSRKNFNPFVVAWWEITQLALKKIGNANIDACPVCLLKDDTIIDKTADKMAETIKNLPDE